jgi:hypothetical protein
MQYHRLLIILFIYWVLLWVPSKSGLGGPIVCHSFAQVVQKTRFSLEKSNSTVFRGLFAKHVVLISIVGVHPLDLTSADARNLFGNLLLHDRHAGGSTVSYYVQSACILDTAHQDSKIVTSFYNIISHAARSRKTSITTGQNLEGQELAMNYLFGPAVEGEVNADTKWRIGYEDIAREWKIRYLIIASAP